MGTSQNSVYDVSVEPQLASSGGPTAATGEEESDGTRRSREAPLGRVSNRERAVASNGKSKQIRRRTSLLSVRHGREPTTAREGIDGEGSLLAATVLLSGDVVKLRDFNLKYPVDCSFLRRINLARD